MSKQRHTDRRGPRAIVREALDYVVVVSAKHPGTGETLKEKRWPARLRAALERATGPTPEEVEFAESVTAQLTRWLDIMDGRE